MGAADKRDATLIGCPLSRTDALVHAHPGQNCRSAFLAAGGRRCWTGATLLSGFAEPRPTYA
ncbi:hypothetical protein ACSC9U_29575 [Pseudomonas solani]|uniref:hypothetical protein n=1 Tax=Pseudomonas solani TaxID=2731552 RepID=UPI003F4AC82D